MMLPMSIFIPSSSSSSENVDYYPDPKTAKALIKDDIIHGGDASGVPQYNKYVYGLDIVNDIYELRDLNNSINEDVERWRPRHEQMKKFKFRVSMAILGGSTVYSMIIGSISCMMFTPILNNKLGIVDIVLGTTMGSISAGLVVLNCYIITHLVRTMRSTPESMMVQFREMYNETFDGALKIKYQ